MASFLLLPNIARIPGPSRLSSRFCGQQQSSHSSQQSASRAKRILSGSTGQAAWRYPEPQEPPGGRRDRQFEPSSLQQRTEQPVIACPQPIARPKVADAGENRGAHWIDEGIDLRIYAQIWKAAAPAHLIDVAVFCVSDDSHTGTAATPSDISVRL